MRDPRRHQRYVYDHWRHVFYPEGLPTGRCLEHYAGIFATVELNAFRDALDLSDLLGDQVHCTHAVRDARGTRPAAVE